MLSYSIKKKLPDRVNSLKELKSLADNYSRSRIYGQDIDEQCGMLIIAGISNLKDNSKEQAIELTRNLYRFDDFYNMRGEKSVSQLILTDVVNRNGHPRFKNMGYYATKKIAHKYKYIGPALQNPNSKNMVRHYTITPRMLVQIYNFDADSK